jgi:cold shock CspA family protein
MVGQVQKFNTLRGFGFIVQDFRTRLFFHVKEWKGDVAPSVGMSVSYEVAPANKVGQLPQATNIVPNALEGAKVGV